MESQQENRDEDGRSSIRMTLRLPATSFEGARSGLRALGQVRHESQEAEDVSTEWVDREARLSVKRAAVASAAFHPLARLGERLVARLGASLAVLVLVLVTLLPWTALAGLGLLIRRRIRAKAAPSPEIPDGSAAP